jgi:hypothetical protein
MAPEMAEILEKDMAELKLKIPSRSVVIVMTGVERK